MKNILILIVFAAVFLHFFPQPEVTKFYNKTRDALDDSFAEFSDTKVRLKSDKILIDLKPELQHFSPKEVELLEEMTSSRKNVKIFFEEFCQSNKRSTDFHPKNQTRICNTIGKYENML